MRTKAEVIANKERSQRIREKILDTQEWRLASEFVALIDSDLERYDGEKIESPIPEGLHRETETLRAIAKLYEEEGGWKVSTWDGQFGYCLTFE